MHKALGGEIIKEVNMAIGNVIQKNTTVHIYDEKGRHIVALPAGAGPGDGLVGYTSTTVNIRRGNTIHTYDDKGRHKYSMPAK